MPLIRGRHQERNLRGGTECVPLIVGMGTAAELARKQVPGYEKKVRPLRDALEEGILSSIPNPDKHRFDSAARERKRRKELTADER